MNSSDLVDLHYRYALARKRVETLQAQAALIDHQTRHWAKKTAELRMKIHEAQNPALYGEEGAFRRPEPSSWPALEVSDPFEEPALLGSAFEPATLRVLP